MLTRQFLRHQYGNPGPGDQSPPPFHVTHHPPQYPYNEMRGENAFSSVPAFIPLNCAGPVGVRRGIASNYDAGYLGMDPLDPQSWIRPLNIAPGMTDRILTYPIGRGVSNGL